jgi:amino acid permease
VSNAAITGATALVAAILFHPRLSRSKDRRAIVTPLASIIGSGFLVIGPILNASFGYMAPAAMAALCGVAYLFGEAIRRNIARLGEVLRNAQPSSASRIMSPRGC